MRAILVGVVLSLSVASCGSGSRSSLAGQGSIDAIAVDPRYPHIVYALQRFDLRKSVDGGETWQTFPLPRTAHEAERWPSPERMRELARIYHEFGDTDKALAFEVWADDALAVGAPGNQPVDPAFAPPPTVTRVARALLDQTAEPAPLSKVLPSALPTRAAATSQ
jgi:hypothetical protein